MKREILHTVIAPYSSFTQQVQIMIILWVESEIYAMLPEEEELWFVWCIKKKHV